MRLISNFIPDEDWPKRPTIVNTFVSDLSTQGRINHSAIYAMA